MISYKPLWKTLIDRNKKKIDLTNDIGINPRTISTMTKGGSVSMNTIADICAYLDCRVEDVVEIINERPK